LIMDINVKKINYWNILTYIVYAIVIIFAFFAISSKYSIFGIKMLVVKSGSMEPTIKTGSLVIDKSFSDYQINEIVTFQNSKKLTETTTHRITNKEDKDGNILFTTKGDANNADDADKLTPDRIVGKVVFKIAYLGYTVAFSRTTPGLIILIIIPATIIIYDEINKIKNEIILKRKERKKAK